MEHDSGSKGDISYLWSTSQRRKLNEEEMKKNSIPSANSFAEISSTVAIFA